MSIEKPYWKCVCGATTKILRDETGCECGDIYEQDWHLIKEDGDEYRMQATVIMEQINNRHALVHWIWNQDFFTQETENGGDSLSDHEITAHMKQAGADEKQVNQILEVVHREDN